MKRLALLLFVKARDGLDWHPGRSLGSSPGLLEPISTIMLIVIVANAAMTGVQLGDAAYQYLEKSSFADEIATMPDTWAESVRERRRGGEISGYRAELETQLIQELRAQTEPLAEKVRAMRDDEWESFLGSQAFQQALSMVGGRCIGGVFCGAAGQQAGQVAAEVGKNLVDFGWNAQSAALSAATADLAVDLEARRGLLKVEMERLLGRQLHEWKTAEPLLEARLHHRIRYLQLHQDEWSDEEFAERARALAISADQIGGITRAGGSEDSPFADYKALADWLVAKARPEAVTEEPGTEEASAQFDVSEWFPEDEREQFCRSVVEPALPADSKLITYVTQFVQGCRYTSCDAHGNCYPSDVGITPYASDDAAARLFDESYREGTDYAIHQARLEGHRLEFTDDRLIQIRTHADGRISIRVDELYGNAILSFEHKNLPSYSLATIDTIAKAVREAIDQRRGETRVH